MTKKTFALSWSFPEDSAWVLSVRTLRSDTWYKILSTILDPRHKNMCSVCFDKKITPSSSSYVYFDQRVQHRHPGSDQFKSSLSNCLWLCPGSLWEPGNKKNKISFLDALILITLGPMSSSHQSSIVQFRWIQIQCLYCSRLEWAHSAWEKFLAS